MLPGYRLLCAAKHRLVFVCWLMTCAPACLANADNSAVFEAGAGAFAISLPAYPGSSDQSQYVLPFPYIYYKSERVTVDREGVIGSLLKGERWEIDASFAAGIPVRSDDSDIRQGMPDLDWTLEAGPRLLYYFSGNEEQGNYLRSHFFVRKAFATDLTYLDQIGYRAGLGLELQRQFVAFNGKPLIWTNRLTALAATENYLNYLYGVPAAYATAGRPEFSSKGGFSGAEFASVVSVRVGNAWIGAFARYARFAGTTQSDSALLEVNANWTVGVGVVWIFRSNRKL